MMFLPALLAFAFGALLLSSASTPRAKRTSSLGAEPLTPDEERFLALGVLYQKDLPLPPGEKRFLTRSMARELLALARKLDLPRTVAALCADRPLPANEPFRNRRASVAECVLNYSRGAI